MDYEWNMYENCMYYACHMHRTCMECAWSLKPMSELRMVEYERNLYGNHMEYAWGMYGMWLQCAWPMLGVCVQYARSMHRLCMKSEAIV